MEQRLHLVHFNLICIDRFNEFWLDHSKQFWHYHSMLLADFPSLYHLLPLILADSWKSTYFDWVTFENLEIPEKNQYPKILLKQTTRDLIRLHCYFGFILNSSVLQAICFDFESWWASCWHWGRHFRNYVECWVFLWVSNLIWKHLEEPEYCRRSESFYFWMNFNFAFSGILRGDWVIFGVGLFFSQHI